MAIQSFRQGIAKPRAPDVEGLTERSQRRAYPARGRCHRLPANRTRNTQPRGPPKPRTLPFCHPHPDDLAKLETDPMGVRALAYDLVLNGWELGSGSIRIHEPDLQQRVCDLLGIDQAEANKRFAVFPRPFRAARPPHAAPGRTSAA